jgi:TAG lipase/steryl ester hydrolase/phospholipase A2/LPA acyltransferase
MTSQTLSDPFAELLHELLDTVAEFLIGNSPLMKKVASEAMETVFATKAVARQLALVVALETGMVTVNQVLRVVTLIFSNFSSRSRLIRHLTSQQNNAATQDEWMDLAERIDNIQGDDVWRSDPDCQLYERERISARIDEFVHLMRRRDIFELMFVLRGGIGRNKFGLLHEGLFSKAMAGSKVLVET